MKKINSQTLPAMLLAFILMFTAGCITIDNTPDTNQTATNTQTSNAAAPANQAAVPPAAPTVAADSEVPKKAEVKTSNDDNATKPVAEKPASNAATPIKFDRGKSSKTVSVSLKKGQSKRYSLDVGKGQVINVEALTDGSTINLINGKDGVDNWQDSTYSLSVLTGRKGIFIFEVANQFDEDLSIPIKVTITNNPDDYDGGIQ